MSKNLETLHRQYVASMRRLIVGTRRPEDTILAREYFEWQLFNPAGRRAEHGRHARTRPTVPPGWTREELDRLQDNRDLWLAKQVKEQDTVMIFTGPQFCDLLAATDNPNVLDLSALERVGNRTAIITYARNINTGVPGDEFVALLMYLSDELSDGRQHIMGAVIHQDDSISSFAHTVEKIGDNLFEVDWHAGWNERQVEMTTEARLITNTMALLAAPNVTTTTEWNHYTKAHRTEAKRVHRKLRPVNVVSLTQPTQRTLDEHHEATHPDRDGWWPVRGHFRLQRVGPGRANRRLVYVHPCRRGNLEGPNIGRKQVAQTA